MRKAVTTETLNDVMEFDHVIVVHEDGTVSDAENVYAPDIRMEVDADGQHLHADDSDIIGQAEREGWELLRGYTGQHGYRGPVMHASEYIGGRMAEDILEEPGTYVVVIVWVDAPEDAPNREELEEEPAGWAVARKL